MSYTVESSSAINSKIEFDLNIVVEKVSTSLSGVHSILLGGGFGRGEGSVVVENGEVRIVNDYDIFVFVKEKNSKILVREIELHLKQELELPLFDLLVFEIGNIPVDQFLFDLSRENHLLYGKYPEDLIRISSFYKPSIRDAQILFHNRVSAVLEMIFMKEIALQQGTKVVLACVDIHNIINENYAVKYADKVECAFGGDVPQIVQDALMFKLKGIKYNLDKKKVVQYLHSTFSDLYLNSKCDNRFYYYLRYFLNMQFGRNFLKKYLNIITIEIIIFRHSTRFLKLAFRKLSKLK